VYIPQYIGKILNILHYVHNATLKCWWNCNYVGKISNTHIRKKPVKIVGNRLTANRERRSVGLHRKRNKY
jgi:hypothetical protein